MPYDEMLVLVREMEPGQVMSNREARERLGIADESTDAYWTARDRLIDEGWIKRRRGRGGSFTRLVKMAQEQELLGTGLGNDNTVEEEREVASERELYTRIERVLDSDWSRDERSDSVFVEVTAHQGPRVLEEYSNEWVRPDLTALLINRHKNLGSRDLEVVTFEVKRGFKRQGIYEALSHSRRAHRSFVLVYEPNETLTGTEFCLEASEVGIGVIIARDVRKYDEWEERVPAEPKNPNSYLIEQFLEEFINDATLVSVRDRLTQI